MFRFLTNLVVSRTNSSSRKPAPAPRRARLGVEALEGRAVPSVSPMYAAMGPAHVSNLKMAQYVAPVVDVANLSGVVFSLNSSSGKPAHELTIQTETYNADGSATFTGIWAGEGPNSNGTGHAITGTLTAGANGSITIKFSWKNGAGTQNSFLGTITPLNSNNATAASVYGPHWHIEGDVTTPVAGDGPGHVSGDGGIPYPMAKMAD